MAESVQNFFDLKAKDINGQEISFERYRGAKAILIANVASRCGYTDGHYKAFVKLYDEYKSKGLEILGFPCNQFGKQEPGNEQDISNYVCSTYDVKFPLFSKVEVNGPNTHNVFQFLKKNSTLYNSSNQTYSNIPWNFGKFLVDSNGKVLGFFSHSVSVAELTPKIQELLNSN